MCLGRGRDGRAVLLRRERGGCRRWLGPCSVRERMLACGLGLGKHGREGCLVRHYRRDGRYNLDERGRHRRDRHIFLLQRGGLQRDTNDARCRGNGRCETGVHCERAVRLWGHCTLLFGRGIVTMDCHTRIDRPRWEYIHEHVNARCRPLDRLRNQWPLCLQPSTALRLPHIPLPLLEMRETIHPKERHRAIILASIVRMKIDANVPVKIAQRRRRME